MWLAAFLEENSNPYCNYYCDKYDCERHAKLLLSPKISTAYCTAVRVYGKKLGTQREECQWPIVTVLPRRNVIRGHPGIYGGKIPREDYNDEWHWPCCSFCFRQPSYDRLRRVGGDNVCYACFDTVRFSVAQIIRCTLQRCILEPFLPLDVRLFIYNLLYCLLLDELSIV
jgi:hypothetical protein